MDHKPAIAIIQARMSSTRLPGKVLKPLAGKPIIWHIYQRAMQCNMVDKVIVATSEDSSDDLLADFCQNNGLKCYRGSLNNVLGRYIDILKSNDYTYFVRITGDCPLIHPKFIDEQIIILSKLNADIAWCRNESPALEGQGVHSTRSLYYINSKSKDIRDKEHVGSIYLAEHPDEFKIVEIELPDLYLNSKFRLTVDEESDYYLFKKIFETLYYDKKILNIKDVLNWLNNNKIISSMNKKVQHKELNTRLKWIRKSWIDVNKVGKYKLHI